MPGRCAAPPAPAMITRRPAVGRALAVREHLPRHPVRRDDVDLVGDVELVERRRGGLHDGPVRVAAHHDADERRASRSFGHRSPREVVAPRAGPASRRSARSSPLTLTWPTLRPGRTSLPYRCTFSAGVARQHVPVGRVQVRVVAAEHVGHDRPRRARGGVARAAGRARRAGAARTGWSPRRRCVQCPLLCGRMASSLTTNAESPVRGSRTSNSSTASTPVTSRSPAIRSAASVAAAAQVRRRGPARGRAPRCRRRRSARSRRPARPPPGPSGLRATSTASSRTKSHLLLGEQAVASAVAAAACRASPAGRRPRPRATRARPCRRSRRAGS